MVLIYPMVSACLVTGDLNCSLWWLSHYAISDSGCMLGHRWPKLQPVMTFSLSWLGMALGRLWWLHFLFSCLTGMALSRLWWWTVMTSFAIQLTCWHGFWQTGMTSFLIQLFWDTQMTCLSLWLIVLHCPLGEIGVTCQPGYGYVQQPQDQRCPFSPVHAVFFPISKQMVSLPVLAIVSACTALDACSCTLCMCLCMGAVRTPSERLH